MNEVIVLKNENISSNRALKFNYRSYACFILLFYFFIFRDILEKLISVLGYVDELIAVLAILYFVLYSFQRGLHKIERYNLCVILFVLMGLLGNFVYDYQSITKSALPDLFLNVKFWLALYAGKIIFSNFNIKLYAKGIYTHVRLVIWLFVFLFILDNIFGVFSLYKEYGLRSTHLFYSHPTYFTWACVYLVTLLICVRKYVSHAGLYFAVCLVLMASTFKIKAITTAIAFLVIYYFVIEKHQKINISILLIFAVIIFAVSWNKIYFYFFSPIRNDSARYYFIITSIKIANEHMPFGSGFGTFASYMSGVNYSPLYAIYEISEVNGISINNTSYISDSFWPMILGQTGWIGMLLMILAIVFLFLKIKKVKYIDFNLYGVGLIILAALILSSVMESSFVNPASIYLALILGLLSNSSKLSKKGYV